jgi:hypothetical protein
MFRSRLKQLVPQQLRGERPVVAEGCPTFEAVILGGGPAGTGPLVWAAQNGQLGAWLDRGIAVVERSKSGSSLGQYALNADSPGRSFLECLDGPDCEPALLEVRRDPVTREMEGWRSGHPPLELVDRFERRVHTAIFAEINRHPSSRVFTAATARALYLQPDGSAVVVISSGDGERQTIHAASAVMALGGQPNTSWDAIELTTGIDFARWRHKIISSHRLLKHGAADQVGQLLVSKDRTVRAVIVGGSHSAFSSAWMLLDRMPDVRFDVHGVQILHRTEPRVTYYSRADAEADSYRFAETDVCQATGRVHRLGGLQGDGRQTWRRISGKGGMEPDNRAVLQPIRDMPRADLVTLLEDADLIVSAFGYRLATIPVFDKAGYPVPLARTGPAVGSDSRLLDADGRAIPGLFGVGLGSGFAPWGGMSGEASFTGQQNSLWLYQHGLGELIHNSTRQLAADWAAAHARNENGSGADVSVDADDAMPLDEVRIR